MNALIAIGLQIDMLPGGPAEVPDSDQIARRIASVAGEYDFYVTACFALPPTHISFAANHPWRKPGQVIQIKSRSVLLRQIFGVQGSFGAEPMPPVQHLSPHFTALMGTHPEILPYSAFFDENKSNDTGLYAFLKTHKVGKLDLAGIPFNIVQNTLLDARELGFSANLRTELTAQPSEIHAGLI